MFYALALVLLVYRADFDDIVQPQRRLSGTGLITV